MTPVHALIFEKHVKMCVYIRHMKTPYVEPPRISEISFRASDEKTTHSIFTHCGASHGAYAHKH